MRPGASLFGRLRSALGVAAVLAFMLLGACYQRFVLWPLALLVPARRLAWSSAFMRGMSRGIFGLLRLGGARFERGSARVDTSGPCLVLMNHQSLLDINALIRVCHSWAPAFVPRARYARGIPAVSLCLRLRDCPLIDPGPGREGRRAAVAIARAAAREGHGLVIFPEGHRTRTGEIGPFKAAGTEAALRARRLPVYLVVTDGFWRARRLNDFVFHAGTLRGRTEVLGPFEPPADKAELTAFVEHLRDTMVAHLAAMRARPDGA